MKLHTKLFLEISQETKSFVKSILGENSQTHSSHTHSPNSSSTCTWYAKIEAFIWNNIVNELISKFMV